MSFKAHIRDNDTYQTVQQHCRNTANYASSHAGAELHYSAFLAGLLHDMGKYTSEFSNYIEKSHNNEKVIKGSVNHTFAGVRFILERWHKPENSEAENITCEIIAIASGAHHGLFDCINSVAKNGFLHRLNLKDILYNEARDNFLKQCANLDELDKLFEQATAEILTSIEKCILFYKNGIKLINVTKSKDEDQAVEKLDELKFCFSLLTRMLLSAVIEGDRRDTAEFMHNIKLPTSDINSQQWEACLHKFEAKLARFSNTSEIDKIRAEISERCFCAAQRDSGIYRLGVPTGGGKTLSSLRYALAAAAKHDKKRVFFVIPLLSVLEQNAKVIREFIDNDDMILEHHSNIIQKQTSFEDTPLDEIFMQTWDKPLVITTLVQFLNTLFEGKTSCIRRMHALDNSIIIIDEAQAVPHKMLSLFNMAINFLAAVCNATVILCSATQPSFGELSHPIYFKNNADLIDIEPNWLATLSRTKLVNICTDTGYTFEEISDFIAERATIESSVLMICNTKSEARTVFDDIRHKVDAQVFHLSTSMCMAHRIKTLGQINYCLNNKLPIVCISTQLVEAGVDFSFGCVVRAFAGMDSIIQAAGRCNRNGEYGKLCSVYIVNIKGEHLGPLKDIKDAQEAAKSILNIFDTQEKLDADIGFLQSIKKYYTILFNMSKVGGFDFYNKKLGTSLYSLLTDNNTFRNCCDSRGKFTMEQAFLTAGSAFHVFEDNTTDVIVPYGAGKEIIAELLSSESQFNFFHRLELLEKVKQFTISLYDYEIKKLQESNGLYSLCDKSILVLLLNPDFYSNEIGFDVNQSGNTFMEA